MTEHNRIKPVLAILVACLWSNPVVAFSIDGVTVLPVGPIAPDDSVTLEVLITTPGSPASLYEPTELDVVGNEIVVDIFPDCGPDPALDSLLENVDLGTFPTGIYHYTIILHPAFEVGWGTRTVTGSFVVVCSLGSCDDDNACTDDVCGPDDMCLNIRNYDDVAFCCNPDTGEVTPLEEGEDCPFPFPTVCGDGSCEPVETSTCPADCFSGPAIPVMSTFGLVLLAAVLLSAGVVVMRRRLTRFPAT